MKSIKWVRNVATSILCALCIVVTHPERWRLGLAIAAGWFVFGCLLDLAIAKVLPHIGPRRIMTLECRTCHNQAPASNFYFFWYPACPGPEPKENQNPVFRCPKCGSNNLEEARG